MASRRLFARSAHVAPIPLPVPSRTFLQVPIPALIVTRYAMQLPTYCCRGAYINEHSRRVWIPRESTKRQPGLFRCRTSPRSGRTITGRIIEICINDSQLLFAPWVQDAV